VDELITIASVVHVYVCSTAGDVETVDSRRSSGWSASHAVVPGFWNAGPQVRVPQGRWTPRLVWSLKRGFHDPTLRTKEVRNERNIQNTDIEAVFVSAVFVAFVALRALRSMETTL